MADEQGEKTEAPTPRKRAEAREQGNIAKSQDLNAAVVILGTIFLLQWFGDRLVTALKTLVAQTLSAASLADVSLEAPALLLSRSVFVAATALAPILLGLMLLGVAVNLAQVGLVLSGKKLQPNLGAVNPLKGISRLFGEGDTLVKFAMNLVKLTLVAGVAYSAVHDRLPQILSVQRLTFIQVFGLSATLVYQVALRVGLLLLVLAFIDYAYQRFRHEKKLKMSKQEVKEEMKRMDGDPLIKQRRRQIAQQIANRKMASAVPTADVVVTNPTEFAVAIRYDAGSMSAPRVVAKGQGHVAAKIRELAIANGVPILERKPLARALYKLVDVGQEIPEQFYSAVAEILAYVYELSGKLRQKQPA